jgi:hypothetical protein
MGITICLAPTWGRYINGGYYGPPVLFDEENAYAFGRFVGERYPFHPYILGGDSTRYWNVGTMAHVKAGKDPRQVEIVDFGAITEAMAKGLVEGEGVVKDRLGVKGYTSMITFHSAQGELDTLRMLIESLAPFHPRRIRFCAIPKFTLADPRRDSNGPS